jgi:hypothetical protein
VFGSDICTCKPYLVFAIEECIRTAQRGGVGVVVYFRKEGRALGEVTKYLVYNLRKRGGDSADKYFRATELIAGVKDMRFQALMPDVLHWLGIKKIDNMVSMSDMCGHSIFEFGYVLMCVLGRKYDAIVQSGIPIHHRYDIPGSSSCHCYGLRSAFLTPGYFQNTLFLWTRGSKSTRKSLLVTSQAERLLLPKTSSRQSDGRGRRRSINNLVNILYSISAVE